MKKHLISFLCLAALAAPLQARCAYHLDITAPWVRATVPAQKASGAFMHLTSTSPAKLVKVSSPAATKIELHKMSMEGGTMKMAQVDAIDLPKDKVVNLASGGYHIMLTGLTRQLKAGDTVELTLHVNAGQPKLQQFKVKVPVKPINFVSPGQAAAH